MKKIIEVECNGFDDLLGERIQVWCGNYIYAGKLSASNDTFIELEDAGVVYETGKLCDSGFSDFQKIATKIKRINRSWIESWDLAND